MADSADFSKVEARIFDVHDRGEFDDGLRLTRSANGRFPERRARIRYWEACFLSLLGSPEESLSLLRAGLDQRMWWAPEWLSTDPDLDAVRRLPGFAELAADSGRLCREANLRRPPPEIAVRKPRGLASIPLLLVLHVEAETQAEREAWWFPAVDSGVAVALLGSPQRDSSDDAADRTWADADLTAEDLEAGIVAVSAELGATSGIILAGFSLSGRVAAQFALRGTPVAARGFIAVGPPAFDPGDEPLERAAARSLRCSLMVGSKDRLRRAAIDLRDALKVAGIQVRYNEMPGVGHEIPPDFGDRLADAIAFVLPAAQD